jgi:hypothetical protein
MRRPNGSDGQIDAWSTRLWLEQEMKTMIEPAWGWKAGGGEEAEGSSYMTEIFVQLHHLAMPLDINNLNAEVISAWPDRDWFKLNLARRTGRPADDLTPAALRPTLTEIVPSVSPSSITHSRHEVDSRPHPRPDFNPLSVFSVSLDTSCGTVKM